MDTAVRVAVDTAGGVWGLKQLLRETVLELRNSRVDDRGNVAVARAPDPAAPPANHQSSQVIEQPAGHSQLAV